MKKFFSKIQSTIIYLLMFLPFGFVKGDEIIIKLPNPIEAETFQELVEAILEVVIAIGTPIAILAVIYSGFLFVSARGNTTKLETAKSVFLWTVVGVAILLGAKLLAMVISGTITDLGKGV